jgi:AAHS family benzoate transporter-like MFS transporter
MNALRNSRLGRAAATPTGLLVIAFVAWALAAMDQSIFGYAVPGLLKEFGVGLEVVGVMISASFVFGMLMPPVAGVLVDLWGPRRVLVTCLAVASLLVWLQSVATSVWMLGVLRVLSYGFSGALSPVTNAMVANSAPPRHRAMYIALLQCAYPFGWFLAAMAFVPLSAGGTQWRGPFAIALVVLPVAVLIYLLMPDARPGAAAVPAAATAQPEGARPHSPLRTLLGPRHRSVALWCSLAFLLYGTAIGGSTFYLPTYCQAGRGYAPDDAALIVGVTHVVALPGYLAAALLGQAALGVRRTTILWAALGGVLFGASVWTPPQFARDIALFGLMATFLFGTASILTTYLLETFDVSIRATAAAVCGSASLTAGFLLGPMLTARAVEAWGWQASFSSIAVPATLAVAVVVAMLPELGTRPPAAQSAPLAATRPSAN